MQANPTRQARITQERWSPMRGKKPLITFSAKVTDGASSVAEEQLMMAESTAPKNNTCADQRRCWSTSVGRTSWYPSPASD